MQVCVCVCVCVFASALWFELVGNRQDQISCPQVNPAVSHRLQRRHQYYRGDTLRDSYPVSMQSGGAWSQCVTSRPTWSHGALMFDFWTEKRIGLQTETQKIQNLKHRTQSCIDKMQFYSYGEHRTHGPYFSSECNKCKFSFLSTKKQVREFSIWNTNIKLSQCAKSTSLGCADSAPNLTCIVKKPCNGIFPLPPQNNVQIFDWQYFSNMYESSQLRFQSGSICSHAFQPLFHLLSRLCCSHPEENKLERASWWQPATFGPVLMEGSPVYVFRIRQSSRRHDQTSGKSKALCSFQPSESSCWESKSEEVRVWVEKAERLDRNGKKK